jgi:hypothetical protein
MHDSDAIAVRSSILRAFAEVARPNKRKLVHSAYRREVWRPGRRSASAEEIIAERRDSAEADGFAAELADRRWEDLSDEFIANRWSAFCYLGAEGYRYYLPALLLAALRNRDFAWTVVWQLQPDAWYVLWHGGDPLFDEQIPLFSPDQHAAVATFLEWAGTGSQHQDFIVNRALLWGWNRVKSRALALARDHARRMSSWTWPRHSDSQVEELVCTIRQAFADRPYPGDDQLCGSQQGTEPAWIALELRGVPWDRAHPDLLAHNYTATSFLSKEGFRYYLPAFMVADLHGAESNADPVHALTDTASDIGISADSLEQLGDALGAEVAEVLRSMEERRAGVDLSSWDRKRWAGFTLPEREAIVKYLEHRKSYDWADAVRIEATLKAYWRPSLAAGC